MVQLELHGDVERATRGGAVKRPVHAEGDPERAARPALEAEAGVAALLAHRPHVADARRGDEQPGLGVPLPERGQELELLGDEQAEALAADDRVDLL